jgi:GNAT superfamily N-acetyltransferase
VVTPDLIKRIAQAEWTWNKTRADKMARLPGNPRGIQFGSFDHVSAIMAQGTETHLFNRAVGLRQGDENLIPKIASYFRDLKRPCYLSVLPGHCDYLLGQSLHENNFYLSNVFTALFGKPGEVPMGKEPEGVTVRMVETQTEARLFTEHYAKAWELPAEEHKEYQRDVCSWLYAPECRAYLALVDSIPAGCAVLSIRAGVGYLAEGAVLPEYRKRGCHLALIQRRCIDAKNEGVKLLACDANAGEQSERNLQRLGFRITFHYSLFADATYWERKGKDKPSTG